MKKITASFMLTLLIKFIFFQYAYAGPSVFYFIFYNNTQDLVTIQQGGRCSGLRGNCIQHRAAAPGIPSHRLFLAQEEGTYLVETDFTISRIDDRWNILCSSRFTFKLTYDGEWRYSTFVTHIPGFASCKNIENTGINTNGTCTKHLPPWLHKGPGNTRFYSFHVQIGL